MVMNQADGGIWVTDFPGLKISLPYHAMVVVFMINPYGNLYGSETSYQQEAFLSSGIMPVPDGAPYFPAGSHSNIFDSYGVNRKFVFSDNKHGSRGDFSLMAVDLP